MKQLWSLSDEDKKYYEDWLTKNKIPKEDWDKYVFSPPSSDGGFGGCTTEDMVIHNLNGMWGAIDRLYKQNEVVIEILKEINKRTKKINWAEDWIKNHPGKR